MLEFPAYCCPGSYDALVRGPPGPKPVLVLCSFLNTGDSDLSQLLDTLHWGEDRTSWATGPPPSPEQPDPNVSCSSKAHQAQ